MAMMTATTQHRRQFSLRSLLVLVGLVNVLFAFVAAYGLIGAWVFCWIVAAVCFAATIWRRKFFSVAAILLLVAVVSSPFVVMDGHPVPLSKLSRVQTGMTSSDVVKILGEPQSTKSFDDGQIAWHYHGITWCMVEVDFSSDGKVTGIIHDH